MLLTGKLQGNQGHPYCGGFDERPGEILVAVLDVAFTLFLAVRDPLVVNASAIGTEVADVGKPRDGTGLKHDRGSEHVSDAGLALPGLEFGA